MLHIRAEQTEIATYKSKSSVHFTFYHEPRPKRIHENSMSCRCTINILILSSQFAERKQTSEIHRGREKCKVECWPSPSVCIVFSTYREFRSKKNALYGVPAPYRGPVPLPDMPRFLRVNPLNRSLRMWGSLLWLKTRSNLIEWWTVWRENRQALGTLGARVWESHLKGGSDWWKDGFKAKR